MKRIILSLLVTACLTACSKNDNDAPDDKKPPVTLEPKEAPKPTVGVYPRIETTTQHLRQMKSVAEFTVANGKVTKSIQKVTDLKNGNVTTISLITSTMLMVTPPKSPPLAKGTLYSMKKKLTALKTKDW